MTLAESSYFEKEKYVIDNALGKIRVFYFKKKELDSFGEKNYEIVEILLSKESKMLNFKYCLENGSVHNIGINPLDELIAIHVKEIIPKLSGLIDKIINS